MSSLITTLTQAEQHLRSSNVIIMNSDESLELVEGKQLLDVCGYAYKFVGSDGYERNEANKHIKRQIEKHGFIEGVDFGKVQSPIVGGSGNRGAKVEYRFTLNAANHVLLAAMTAEGKHARHTAINLAVAVQANPLVCDGSDFREAYIGAAKQRAGLTVDKVSQWRVALASDIELNGVKAAAARFIEATGGKVSNQLVKEQRASLLQDAIAVMHRVRKAWGIEAMSKGNFDLLQYAAFDAAILALSERRSRVLALLVTDLHKQKSAQVIHYSSN